MGYLLEVLTYGSVIIAELIGVIIAGMLIQGIVYWITGFSIYNYLIKRLITDQLK